MTTQHPFLRHIDHIGIQATDPHALFQFFCDTLGLPVSFPFVQYPQYTSGSVSLGNLFLELMRFGPPGTPPVGAQRTARYHILGLLVREGTLADALHALDQRGLAHSAIIPFYAATGPGQARVKIWSNAYLAGLLGDNLWLRLFFALSRLAGDKPVDQNSSAAALATALLKRAFDTGMLTLTDYHQQNDDAKRATDRAALVECGGGVLGVLGVREVVVGVRQLAESAQRWSHLFAPIQPADGAWPLGEGPSLRLVQQPVAGIQTMILHVASLDAAEAALQRLNLTHTRQGERLSFELPHTQGLTMELVA
jgi:catechol 2,3-dioxygenase-like lactoylglutathione lyase family enzyme